MSAMITFYVMFSFKAEFKL